MQNEIKRADINKKIIVFILFSDLKSVTCSADPINNSETTNLDFHEVFDQFEQGFQILKFRYRTFGIGRWIRVDTGLHSDIALLSGSKNKFIVSNFSGSRMDALRNDRTEM